MLQISIEQTARLKISPADAPPDRLLERVDESNILQSRGYRAMRRWFESLSPGAKQRARTWMRNQLLGVDKLKREVEAQGDTFSYADLDMDIRAANTGELISGGYFPQDDSTEPTSGDGEKQPEEEQPT